MLFLAQGWERSVEPSIQEQERKAQPWLEGERVRNQEAVFPEQADAEPKEPGRGTGTEAGRGVVAELQGPFGTVKGDSRFSR